ncbi:MAG: hypothetical protein M3Y41_09515 [Pseudomonadota bacterium]|nr:hypothetical protein [Pseudomonadota bacterium]
MKNAKATLEQGLQVGAQEGKPISAKFEVEDKKLRLSLYTVVTDSGYAEVLVDPEKGALMSAEKITDSGDLKAATDQRAAMDKANASLATATERAVRENPGSRAVSVFPIIENGKPVANVTLLRGDSFKTAAEQLD